MYHSEPTDEIRATAALYSLGALDPAELLQFREHLSAGCETCEKEVQSFEAVAARIPLALPEIAPPPSLRERLLQRVASPEPSMVVIRHSEGKWRDTPFPGVKAKTLHYDRETAMLTNLLRIEPGASYPPHRHKAVEHCLVLEGDVLEDGVELGPGDYSRIGAHTEHGRIYTKGGCLLLIISSAEDELLAAK